METIFLLLSGAILLAGVLYWFWSHIQLTQKKVHLLENAVFELRTMLAGRGPPGPVEAPVSESQPPALTPFRDLDDDDWSATDATAIEPDVKVISSLPAPIRDTKEVHTLEAILAEHEIDDDAVLQPGSEEIVVESGSEEQFKSLFVPPATDTPAAATDALDGMPVKELRRLAEQRGIIGADGMRKKEILAALKGQIQMTSSVEKVEELTVEEMPAVE